MSGYSATADGGTLSFDLGLGIVVRDSVRISFAPSCANDVIVGDVTAPVPEPTAALVFGIGLAAVTRAVAQAAELSLRAPAAVLPRAV